MKIKSLEKEYTKKKENEKLFNLTTPSFLFNKNGLREYTVKREHSMRVDLILQDIYNLEPDVVESYIENIDVLLYLNNIDNPLNIKEGQVLLVPSVDDFDKYRYERTNVEIEQNNIKEKLVMPNKRKSDKDRKKFKENNYSLPPVVLSNPRDPVRINNSNFSVGGL